MPHQSEILALELEAGVILRRERATLFRRASARR
jgi:hypothetical protein